MSLPLPRWFAHRGGGALAPENTLAGIRLAARMGFAAVEFDVMQSGDGTPVLIHDETLERTTNGRGLVCETPDARLFTLDAGNGERVPRYADAVAACREYGLLANVEIKPATGFERQTAETVARRSSELWQGARVPPLISSFSLEALEIARDLAPQIPRGVLFERVPADWLSTVRRLQAVTLHCAARHLSDDVLAEAQANGIAVLCYTVNTENAAKSLFSRGVSAVFTDRLDLFVSETSAYKGLHLGG
ncbi:MAG: glycerophosphodiester phosphodiesterase [Gammaproteobacteria bacterium]|nr:glycerophosphodiester phosphodiesterase [Gammaproteobacteria bacterium]MBU1601294.1 glycerophosphodiester phosphodiesterase [Gammaproteobacteria bacterium]MBU2433875.1 glycerophosphodiester phosphodiesterase [Gammaproteobacteria bacterium]MBU2450607.1 glycerophosphodiester phosphodiesterase [Gammaproteobacteria bacterium]